MAFQGWGLNNKSSFTHIRDRLRMRLKVVPVCEFGKLGIMVLYPYSDSVSLVYFDRCC